MEIHQYNQINIARSSAQRVVVVGGGFAGLALVESLRGSGLQVVLLDTHNYHQFQPLLYQVATSGLEPTAISFPLRRVLRRHRDFHFRMASVTEVDSQAQIVHTDIGDLDYDFLVIAAGAKTNYFGIQNIEQQAFPLKSVAHALALRNHIYRTLELSIDISDLESRQPYLNFVIVGGGPTGVELAGALAELRNRTLPADYPDLDLTKMQVVLINASDRLLDTFSPQSSHRALTDLQHLGVQVLLNSRVYDYLDGKVLYNDNQSIPTETLVWVSGITANIIPGMPQTGRGARIAVDDYNRVQGLQNVFAVGDIAAMTGSTHPQVAQVAIQQARLVGQNIIRNIRNQQPQPFAYRDKGSMATIGRNRAVAEIKGKKINGFIAWIAWLFVHLLFIVGVRNKFTVIVDWAWSYTTHDQPLRSIIEAATNDNKKKI